MPRNLDLTAVRAFVTVADAGGVTRAARLLNLTQSAVSMQLKRLEDSLGQPLLDRSGRGIGVTAQGEQLLAYGRRLLALNDEVWARLTDQQFTGELRLGVPYDIVYPHVPGILQRFAADFPRVKVRLVSSVTQHLRDLARGGGLDLYLTTEEGLETGGETLDQVPLLWSGARGGNAWRERPLRFATCADCIFRPYAVDALARAAIPWEQAVETGSDRAIEATVSADLAVRVVMRGSEAADHEEIRHGGALPPLPEMLINLYRVKGSSGAVTDAMASMIRAAYGKARSVAAE
jgi:DNA-binding transcriptional LysR family regulator